MSKQLRILLSNDDGINAPGLMALEKIARALSDDVWIVAPETEESGAVSAYVPGLPVYAAAETTRRRSAPFAAC